MHHNHKDFSFMDPTPEILLHALFKQVRSSLLLNRVCIFLLMIPAQVFNARMRRLGETCLLVDFDIACGAREGPGYLSFF